MGWLPCDLLYCLLPQNNARNQLQPLVEPQPSQA